MLMCRVVSQKLCANFMVKSKGLIKSDWVFHTGRICHVWCNYLAVYMCRTTIIVETVNDNNLKIISLPITLWFQLQKRLAKWRQLFVKDGFKKLGLLS